MNLEEVSAYTGRAVREERFKPGSAPERAFKEQGEPKPGRAANRGFHGLCFKLNCFVSVLGCPDEVRCSHSGIICLSNLR